jgi:hypothetical protein
VGYFSNIYELKNEITIFLEKKSEPEAEKFRNDLFVVKLSYLVEIFEKLDTLNLQLQGPNMHRYTCFQNFRVHLFFAVLNQGCK